MNKTIATMLIREDIEDAILNIFAKYQDRLGITSGDELGDLELDEKYEKSIDFLAYYIEKTLEYETTTNPSCARL